MISLSLLLGILKNGQFEPKETKTATNSQTGLPELNDHSLHHICVQTSRVPSSIAATDYLV